MCVMSSKTTLHVVVMCCNSIPGGNEAREICEGAGYRLVTHPGMEIYHIWKFTIWALDSSSCNGMIVCSSHNISDPNTGIQHLGHVTGC